MDISTTIPNLFTRLFTLDGIMLPLIICLCVSVSSTISSAEPNVSELGTYSEFPAPVKPYYIEISISGKTLTLFQRTEGELVPVRQYPVGTAVPGLDAYPMGLGKVTGIYLDPWWHPTPYSRHVFRKRGIELPAAVPPGHPLNYMGKVKITLSHRTWKGAIYRIHGVNYRWRVGKRVTGGCFAMYNEDGLELARTIPVGTQVNILP